MTESKKTYFAFSFSEEKYVLGLTIGYWTWFYDYYFDNPEEINSIQLENLKELFVLDKYDLGSFKKTTQLSPTLYNNFLTKKI